MNPATVKQILGEKSMLAMYRDCLKAVPLMNSEVRNTHSSNGYNITFKGQSLVKHKEAFSNVF